jgi:hypothetical protein
MGPPLHPSLCAPFSGREKGMPHPVARTELICPPRL